MQYTAEQAGRGWVSGLFVRRSGVAVRSTSDIYSLVIPFGKCCQLIFGNRTAICRRLPELLASLWAWRDSAEVPPPPQVVDPVRWPRQDWLWPPLPPPQPQRQGEIWKYTMKIKCVQLNSEASLIVPDFTISVSGSSCNYLFFRINVAPLLSLSA